MNLTSHPSKKPNAFLHAIGATSWNDAVLCILVYTFLILLVFSFITVVGTFVGSLVSGLAPITN